MLLTCCANLRRRRFVIRKRPRKWATTTPNRSWRSPPAETSASVRVRFSHPSFSGPQPSGSPCLTSKPTFVSLRRWKRTLSASDSGSTPRRAKSDFLSVRPGGPKTFSYHEPKNDFLSVVEEQGKRIDQLNEAVERAGVANPESERST
jgi:hypothetical protein